MLLLFAFLFILCVKHRFKYLGALVILAGLYEIVLGLKFFPQLVPYASELSFVRDIAFVMVVVSCFIYLLRGEQHERN